MLYAHNSQSTEWAADILHLLICLFDPLYCDIISLISLKSHKPSIFIIWFCRKLNSLLRFQIQNNVWIIKGSDN